MKIRLVIREFWPLKGGLTLHALRLAQEMTQRGHDFQVITPFIEKRPAGNARFWMTERSRKVTIEGVTCHVIGLSLAERLFLLPLKKLQWRAATRGLAKSMLTLVYRQRFRHLFADADLVHYDGAGLEFLGFAAGKVAREMNLPFVIQPSVHLGQWGHLPVDHEFFRLADSILAHSKVEAEYLHKVLGGKVAIHTVYNGIDVISGGDGKGFRARHGIHGRMILFLGRKEDDKGYFLMREAFREVGRRIPGAHLVSVGPGAGLPPESHAIELGYVTDKERADAFAACDVLAVPSEGESFGLVFLEAGRARKPFVARDLELFEDLLGRNGESGLRIGTRFPDGTVQLGPQELCDALVCLLNDSARRVQMGRAGFMNSERFLWRHIAELFEIAYRETLSEVKEIGLG